MPYGGTINKLENDVLNYLRKITILESQSDTSFVLFESRIKRGLYKTYKGKLINANINDALNIMKKTLTTSKAGDLRLLSNLCIVGNVDVHLKNKAGLRLTI